jgi:predicted nucleotidyltransferase
MTLLQTMASERALAQETSRKELRQRVRSVLTRILPGARVIFFGSLIKPGRFNEFSDLDLALESEPAHMSIYQLTAILAEETGRRADVVLLPECRFSDRIKEEGEHWTVPG